MESTQLPPRQQQRPRLERLRSDRAVAGVASGLARHLAIEVAWVRIAFVVTAIFGGAGILLYLIGWIAIPDEGSRESIAADKARDLQGSGSWIGFALIVLAGVIIVGNTGIVDAELVFAGALIAFGVLLYRGDFGNNDDRPESLDFDAPAESPIDSPPPYAETSALVDEPVQDRVSYSPPPSPPVTAPSDPDPAFQPRPLPPRENSPLGRVALAGALIAVGVIGFGQSAGWFEPELRHYAAAIFVVFGAALLVSSIYGRARWLIGVGLVLSPLLIGASLLSVPFEGGFGEVNHSPTVVSLEDEYRLIAGEMTLDLTDMDLEAGESVEIETSVVFGRLEIIVPPDLGADVTTRLDAGEMKLDGEVKNDHLNAKGSISFEGAGQVLIDARVGFGELVVREIQEVSP